MKKELNLDSLSAVLNDLGITKGDVLYISSDIKVLLYKLAIEHGLLVKNDRDKAINSLIDLFQRTVGENGTLLFPVFSWGWCRGNGFDIKTTKGEVGTLSNWVLQNR